MEVYLTANGDPSVGIFAHTTTIEIGAKFADPSIRKEVRELLAAVVSGLEVYITDILFEDECPDCYTIGYGPPCANPACIQNCVANFPGAD